jgi:hypothetical protein
MKTDMTKAVVSGALGGAIGLAIIGFGWGGWVTSSTAEARAKTSSQAAVVGALAPICATQFQQASDAAAQQAVFYEESLVGTKEAGGSC